MIDKRDGQTRKPAPTGDTMFPRSEPQKPGRGKGSSGVPDSQKPAPRHRGVD